MTNFEVQIFDQMVEKAEIKVRRVMKANEIFTTTVVYRDDTYILSTGADWKGLSVEIFSEECGRQLVEDPGELLIWLAKEAR